MLKLMALIETYAKNEDGATSVEMGLIIAGIALAISAVVWTYGGQFSELLDSAPPVVTETPAN